MKARWYMLQAGIFVLYNKTISNASRRKEPSMVLAAATTTNHQELNRFSASLGSSKFCSQKKWYDHLYIRPHLITLTHTQIDKQMYLQTKQTVYKFASISIVQVQSGWLLPLGVSYKRKNCGCYLRLFVLFNSNDESNISLRNYRIEWAHRVVGRAKI